MRIISGTFQRRVLRPPANLPVRPTTDLAKEALFSVIGNQMDIAGARVLDLFAGTGSISFEFASRGAEKVISVDLNFKCIEYIKRVKNELNLQNLHPLRSDSFRYLKSCRQQFDVIFADPPFDLEGTEAIASLIFERSLLGPEGKLIIEHPGSKSFMATPGFVKERKYGKVHFSFFENNVE